MQQFIVNHGTALSDVGSTMTYGGAATAVFFGVRFNQAEVQLIGVISGIVIGLLGLIGKYIVDYYKYKLEVQIAIKTEKWDGVERRQDGSL